MKLTLCGSARFESEFHKWNELLTLAGHVVYSLAVFPSQKKAQLLPGTPEHEWYTDEQKEALDRAHRLKIKNSDAIVVLNVGGYVGESTRNEVKYAASRKMPIYWLTMLSPEDESQDVAERSERKRFNRSVIDLVPAADD